MARQLKAEVGGLNIRLHPHDPQRYRDLFASLFKLKKIVPIYGDRSGLITSLQRISHDAMYIEGVITTFLDLDLKGDWFNTDTMEEASDNDREKINVPEYLRPNIRTFFFSFDVENHELIFEHYGNGHRFSHQSAFNFFENLVHDSNIMEKYGDVKISIIQSKGSIDRIFSIPRITDIEIYIERPNSDLWGDDFEEQAEDHLGDKNARSMTVIYKSEKGSGIHRDEDLERLIRASIRNGKTVAKGYGNNGHEVVNTGRYPKIVQDKFDQDAFSSSEMFRRLARVFRRR
ncbi:DUF4747 family protein [uncultured Sphingomonas sp.]|uniref:DUF4747 family protein n=1 Tax=uncultured Sphingomonas sp. TaxID=158754 RepID=UPI0025EBDA34|nr:DUF4747 family protein [uncultured Sphingomonas sp.]